MIDNAQAAYNWKLAMVKLRKFGVVVVLFAVVSCKKLPRLCVKSCLKNLLLDPYFTNAMNEAQAGWRKAIASIN